MKSVGIVRRVDKLGRIVLPIELRRTLGINIDDPMEIFGTQDGIVIRPYLPGCNCCGCTDNLTEHKEVSLCKSCIEAFFQRSGR